MNWKILIAIAGCMPLNLQAEGVGRKFDRFKNLTTFSAKSRLDFPSDPKYRSIFYKIEMLAMFSCPGDVASCSPSAVTVHFAFGDHVKMLYPQSTIEMLINDKPVSVGRVVIDGTILGADDYFEIAEISLPTTTFLGIVQAETVEIQIAGMEFRLTTENFVSLGSLREHIATTKKRPQNSN